MASMDGIISSHLKKARLMALTTMNRRPGHSELTFKSHNMNTLIKNLTNLVPIPGSPRHAGTRQSWDDVEKRLGTGLPSDYKEFINLYGTGDLCDLFWILSPFKEPPENSLLGLLDSLLEPYLRGRTDFPERCPFPAYPEPGGLLPFGGTTNGDTAFWLTRGQPDEWT